MVVCSHVFRYFVRRKSERVNEAVLRKRGSISGRVWRFYRFQILVVLLLRVIGFMPPFPTRLHGVCRHEHKLALRGYALVLDWNCVLSCHHSAMLSSVPEIGPF